MIIVGAIALMVFLGCGLYGWGAVTRRATGLPPGTWPMTVAIGLAAWIAIGGLLNLLHIAFPPVICLLLVAGCGLMAWSWWTRYAQARAVDPKARKEGSGWLYPAVWLGLAAVIIGFAVVTQTTPSMFNHHDDYQKYFGYVVRMVQTGTLAGSPLNTLGSATPGGQTFLQALFVAYLPLAAINVADAVFCFGLTVLLAGGIASQRPAMAPVALLGMMVVWVIEPQYVNVSALYSAAALMFAVVTLGVDKREYAVGGAVFSSPATTGLIYAALVALKPTFALFIALHFLFCTAADIVASRRIGAAVRRAFATAVWSVIFFAPWIALYSQLYWAAWTAPIAALPIPAPVPAVETIDLLDVNTLFCGGSYAQYTFAAATFLFCGTAVLVRRRFSDPGAARFVAICLVVPSTYLIMMLVMGPLLAGYIPSLRYFLPILIGTVPAVLALCSLMDAPEEQHRAGLVPSMSAGLAAVLAVWSIPDFWSRYQLLVRTGSELAYVRAWPAEPTERMLAASLDMLQQPALAKHLADLQQQVPVGEPFLAWIETPFLLDFKRNPIIDADLAGLANPWARTPPVSYVMWQYGGLGIRQPRDYAAEMRGPGRGDTYIFARGLVYATRLQNLLARSQVIANDGSTVLLRIGPDALP
jgi:hypothetical protein